MKKLAYFLFGVSIFIFILTLAVFLLGDRILSVEKIYTSAGIVEKSPGFDLSSGVLTFGNIQKYGSSTRNVLFLNDYDFPVLVYVSAEGNINSILNYEKIVKVESGEEKEIPFVVSASDEDEYGFYEGEVKFVVKPSR